MSNAQMSYRIGTFNPITIGNAPGTGPTPQFTTVSVQSFVQDSHKKVSQDGNTPGLVVKGKGSVDIDFTVAAPAGNPGGYSYSLASAFFKLTAGVGSTKGVPDEFPKQALSVDKNNVTWLTITDRNNANSTNAPVFEFYLVVYR
ncbi:MAG: hypothetical protein RJA10_2569, partial [Pseudomonadota bacterium]